MNKNIQTIFDQLDELVTAKCKATNRDPTHGEDHMRIVAELSLDILENTELPKEVDRSKTKLITLYGAWLHDYADYKYDSNGELEKDLIKIIHEHFDPIETYYMILLIKSVSYSYEVALTNGKPFSQIALNKLFGGKQEFIFARNIISDADKIQAIGKMGVQRCIGYCKEQHEKENKPYNDEIGMHHLQLHADDKLLRLYSDDFIRTYVGRKYAYPHHMYMLEYLNRI